MNCAHMILIVGVMKKELLFFNVMGHQNVKCFVEGALYKQKSFSVIYSVIE